MAHGQTCNVSHVPVEVAFVDGPNTAANVENTAAKKDVPIKNSPLEKQKQLRQTRLDQFQIIPHAKDEGVATPKATATDPEVVRLVGTITFPFRQAPSDSILNNNSILQFPRVSGNEIDVFSTTKGQTRVVRVAEQGSLLDMRRYRQAAYEKFAAEKKALEAKKRLEQKAILHARIAKVQMEANQVLLHGNEMDAGSKKSKKSSKYCCRVSSPASHPLT